MALFLYLHTCSVLDACKHCAGGLRKRCKQGSQRGTGNAHDERVASRTYPTHCRGYTQLRLKPMLMAGSSSTRSCSAMSAVARTSASHQSTISASRCRPSLAASGSLCRRTYCPAASNPSVACSDHTSCTSVRCSSTCCRSAHSRTTSCGGSARHWTPLSLQARRARCKSVTSPMHSKMHVRYAEMH